MHHTISDSSIQTNTKYFKECPKVSIGESRRKRVPTPMHKFMRSRNPQVDHQNIHQVNHVISHCHHRYPRQDIHQVFSSLQRLNPIRLLQSGNSIHYKREEGGRNIIGSKYNSKGRDTSRLYHLKNTREREREIKHIATGTYPQPRG